MDTIFRKLRSKKMKLRQVSDRSRGTSDSELSELRRQRLQTLTEKLGTLDEFMTQEELRRMREES
jgi:hypothetical protein